MPRKSTTTIGSVIGKLTVFREGPKADNGKRRFYCLCECGNETLVSIDALTTKNTKSCGCLRKEKRALTHGLTGHPLFNRWRCMISRCTNPKNPSYHRYGGRGIKVCERWLDPANFIEDMLPKYVKGMHLDRINNDGDYTPDNVRFASRKVNQRNRSVNRLLTMNGKTATVAEWSEAFGIPHGRIIWRINAGWSVYDAITKPPRIKVRSRRFDQSCP